MRVLAFLILMAGSASAQLLPVPTGPVCPPERPHQKLLATARICTAMACLGPLKCNGIFCERSVSSDCNTCKPQYEYLCLSDEELRAAEGQ